MGDEQGLDDDVTSGAPGRLPGSNVDVDEVHLQVQVIELEEKESQSHSHTQMTILLLRGTNFSENLIFRYF